MELTCNVKKTTASTKNNSTTKYDKEKLRTILQHKFFFNDDNPMYIIEYVTSVE